MERVGEPDLAAGLRRAEAYPHAVADIEVVETHISWVFLTGKLAYKVKKPVTLPFLDFSTLAARKRFCEAELALNRRLAPELYLDVVPIGGAPGAPRVGVEPAREYAVQMRQFPSGARLDRALAANAVDASAVVAFAERLAAFHDELPALGTDSPDAAARAVVVGARANVSELEALLGSARGSADASAARADSAAADATAAQLAAAAAWTEQQCAALLPVLAQRYRAGAHRDCHGDMHLQNLVVLDGKVVAFDALEFDPALRATDRASETAFVVMDLLAHGRANLAFPFLTRYLETGGDYDGLRVLRFYLVQRALVRAKVHALRPRRAGGNDGNDGNDRRTPGMPDYVALAARLAAPRPPLLVLMHGLSGSGKTSISSRLLEHLPAVRVRSDVERKRLLGLDSDSRTDSPVGGGAYTSDVSQRTYARLHAVAAVALEHGFDVVVDAAFLMTAQRAPFAALAQERGARLRIVDCAASADELRRRVAARAAEARDESEAGAAVLEWQLAHGAPLAREELANVVRVDTEREIDFLALAQRLAGSEDPASG